MNNQEFQHILQDAFQRGFQKRAMVGSSIRFGAGIADDLARTAAARAPLLSSYEAALARSAGAADDLLRPGVNPWATARNSPISPFRVPYTGGTPESLGLARLAGVGNPWWKFGLGSGGGLRGGLESMRTGLSQGLANPYIKYPLFGSAALGTGWGFGQMTRDPYPHTSYGPQRYF